MVVVVEPVVSSEGASSRPVSRIGWPLEVHDPIKTTATAMVSIPQIRRHALIALHLSLRDVLNFNIPMWDDKAAHPILQAIEDKAVASLLSKDEYEAAYDRFLSNLQAARKQANLTQEEVARHLGKPQSFVSKIESGERRLDFVEVVALARIYGKELSYFA